MAMRRSGDDAEICKKAAALIVKYDIHKGQLVPVKPFETVPDPTNREGQFALFEDCLQCAEDVAGIGYDVRYAKSIVTQLPLKEADLTTILEFSHTRHLADKRLPGVDFPRVAYSGSAGNTMFLFMRAAHQGSAAGTSWLGDENGNLSIRRLTEVSAPFAAAATDGIPSTILSRNIRSEEPTGLHIIQAAENAIGGVQRLEGAVAICKRVCLLIATTSVFTLMGMEGIVSMVKRQVPHMVDEVDGISQWALVQGGAGSMHIDWLAKQHELHIPGRRKLKGELWMSIAVDIPPRLVKVRRGLTYMAFSCPKGCMEGDYCVWIHPKELKSLVSYLTRLSSDRWISFFASKASSE